MSVNTYINGQLHRVGGIAYYKAGQSIQVNVMPEASASLINRVYQYIGATTENYTHGFFYECVLEDGAYSWQILDTNPEMESISNSNLANMWASGGGSSVNVEPLSVINNGVYNAPSGSAYNPVTVDIEMDTLSAPKNGVYEIDTTTQNGWDTVVVDTYEKYNVLFRWNGWSSPGNYETLTKPISTTDYDEFWMVGHYTSNSVNNLWNSRFPTSIIFDTPSALYGVFGSDNYLWSHVYANSVEQDNQYGYCYPCMYIGVKNKDREQELLWQNSSYGSAPSIIELSDSIFDYDEICLYFVNVTAGSHHTTVWYPTSQLNINDTVYGYNDYDGAICKYTITANDTLSVVSEAVYTLYAVYGIKDNSMQETVLFTNPSDSTTPATVTLSDAYTNYDEIVLVGHISGETTKGTQYYPVKALTGFDEMNLTQKVGIFTDTTNCWLSITSDTTLVPDSAYAGVVVDKIIGIKRPVVTNAEPLPVKYIDDNKGIICYDNSGVSPIGFKNTDKLESGYISMPTDTAVTVEFCGVVSTNDTYGRIWQIGTYDSVGNTFAYDNSGSSPMFELAIHDSWDTHQIDATDYLDTLITVSIVIDSDTKVYINGTLVSNAITFTKSDIVSDENEIRFLHGTTSSRAADGDIYAFRIYHRALTQAEIQQNVQADIYNFGSTT